MFNSERVENLGQTSRVLRALTGAALIGVTMQSGAAPLGWLAVLPLLAIYPMFTAISGWSPLKALFGQSYQGREYSNGQLSTATRVILAATGVVAIGSVYTVSGPVGNLIILPLLGIYPVFTAILGEEPVTALISQNVSQTQDAAEEHFESESEEHDGHHHHEYRHAA